MLTKRFFSSIQLDFDETDACTLIEENDSSDWEWNPAVRVDGDDCDVWSVKKMNRVRWDSTYCRQFYLHTGNI